MTSRQVFPDKTATIQDKTGSVRHTTGWLTGGWSHSQDQELGRIGEISNMFDILLGKYNRS